MELGESLGKEGYRIRREGVLFVEIAGTEDGFSPLLAGELEDRCQGVAKSLTPAASEIWPGPAEGSVQVEIGEVENPHAADFRP
jgi:hypothetical protein